MLDQKIDFRESLTCVSSPLLKGFDRKSICGINNGKMPLRGMAGVLAGLLCFSYEPSRSGKNLCRQESQKKQGVEFGKSPNLSQFNADVESLWCMGPM